MVTPLILAIDPGATSGAAILDAVTMHEWATVKTARERREMVCLARQRAAATGAALVVVGESWKGRRTGTMSMASITGLGAAWGRWLEQLEIVNHPKRRIIRIDTGTWRKTLFGGRRRKGAEFKELARRWCKQRYGIDLPHDVAEAACLGNAALMTGLVDKVLPKGKR